MTVLNWIPNFLHRDTSRTQSIDVLRGVAILLVLLAHFDVVTFIRKGSWIGVDLFFVLSGFLVTGLLFNEHKKFGDIHIGRFLIRRGFKIYPMLYAYVAVAALYFIALNKPFEPRQLYGDLFFLQNYLGALMPHTWSLAVEEHFYLLMPVLLVLLLRFKKQQPMQHIPYIWFGIALVCLLLRWNNNLQGEYTALTHHYPTHLRIDAMFFGTTLAYYYHYQYESFIAFGKQIWVLPIGLLLVSLPYFFAIDTFFINVFGLLFIYLGFGLVVVSVVSNGYLSSSNWILALVSLIGVHSYAIYLWHLAIRNVLLSVFAKLGLAAPDLLTFIIYLLATVIGGIVLSSMLDMPFLRLRDKWFPRRVAVGLKNAT